jgi:hypothetical protein
VVVISVRPFSSSLPAPTCEHDDDQDGLGTCHGLGLTDINVDRANREGCRGFAGPFPPPLWMSNMQLLLVL